MISSTTQAPKIELHQTRPLQLHNEPSIDFNKAKQQYSLPYQDSEQTPDQQTLNQHIDQVLEQQVGQISDKPELKAELHQHKPLSLATSANEPLLELIDLDTEPATTVSVAPEQHLHKPLGLGRHPTFGNNPASSLHTHKPLALIEQPHSLTIEVLTQNISAILREPSERYQEILNHVMQAAPTNSRYQVENQNPAASQVANKDTIPNLAWQETLWF